LDKQDCFEIRETELKLSVHSLTGLFANISTPEHSRPFHSFTAAASRDKIAAHKNTSDFQNKKTSWFPAYKLI